MRCWNELLVEAQLFEELVSKGDSKYGSFRPIFYVLGHDGADVPSVFSGLSREKLSKPFPVIRMSLKGEAAGQINGPQLASIGYAWDLGNENEERVAGRDLSVSKILWPCYMCDGQSLLVYYAGEICATGSMTELTDHKDMRGCRGNFEMKFSDGRKATIPWVWFNSYYTDIERSVRQNRGEDINVQHLFRVASNSG